ncbi:MAG: hypothetical protein UU48_C0032G0003 [Candidatus Uhrbacteria bacterium GW2011_GWF2_41_16]|uniref:Uncharacterized protein n=1 Tax=Candidatus Uhrbacteria bacterium GW2011_GWF2_41_16 TaxID=1618997 RepID=A0A0G0V5Z2_9BACT|nr:MAG: hypothetical protein UU48_C0032G0003 [Candidatus Uhrbacteria bacterium GW2011_GWF2_41_16]
MTDSPKDPMEFLKRILPLHGGVTPLDHRDLRILIAHGFEPKAYARLEGRTSFRELKQSLNLVPFNPPTRMDGDIILGRNTHGINRYHSVNATSHLLGLGATGVGKTVLLIFLLLQYLFIASGMWIFDFIKRELRGFKRLAERLGFSPIICRYEWLRINLLDPQGLDPAQYANICAEFITLNLGLPTVAKHILKICIIRLYERFGLFNNSNAAPPLLAELVEEVRIFKGNSSAKEAILIRLEALLANKQEIFNIRRGFPIRELAKKIIIWECDGLEMQYQNLFVSYLISMLFAIRVAEHSQELVLVALDEGGKIYSKRAESANEGPSYISTMTSVIRKMFIALFVWNQTTYDLSNSIIANSGIKILCRLGSAQDYEVFGRAMGLTSAQIQWCKLNLGVGMQVIKMGFGWQEPFLNYSRLIHIPDNVSDNEARASAQTLLDMVSGTTTPILYLPAPHENPANEPNADKLTPDEEILYEHVAQHPDITSATEHYQLTGLGTKRGTAAKEGLKRKKQLKETPIESGKRGGTQLYLEPIYLGGGRLGSGVHRLLRKKAYGYHLTQNCDAQEEKRFDLDGRTVFVDMAVRHPDGRTEAIEVETEDGEHVLENIRKNLALGFDIISVLTPNRKVRDAIKKRAIKAIDTNDIGRIHFPAISFYDK